MKKISVLFILIFIFIPFLKAQSFISAVAVANYWEHTELFGYGGGIGYSKKINKNSFNVQFSYAYGEYNRYKTLKNIDYTIGTTVVITKENWVTDLGAGGSLNRPQNTDYARNLQLNLSYKFPVYKKINLAVGVFCAYVEHAYTFKSIKIYDIYAFPFVGGSYNFIPISEQNFYTAGVDCEVSIDFKKDNKIYSPFVNVGIGPHHSSYYSIGLRLSSELLTK